MEKVNEPQATVHESDLLPKVPDSHGLINASGHRQELDRNFRLINICGLGITSGNTWLALGGSIVCEFHSCVAWRLSLMALRLLQSTMEDLQASFTNCMFSSLFSVLSSNDSESLHLFSTGLLLPQLQNLLRRCPHLVEVRSTSELPVQSSS
jgi:hypothetical protein